MGVWESEVRDADIDFYTRLAKLLYQQTKSEAEVSTALRN